MHAVVRCAQKNQAVHSRQQSICHPHYYLLSLSGGSQILKIAQREGHARRANINIRSRATCVRRADHARIFARVEFNAASGGGGGRLPARGARPPPARDGHGRRRSHPLQNVGGEREKNMAQLQFHRLCSPCVHVRSSCFPRSPLETGDWPKKTVDLHTDARNHPSPPTVVLKIQCFSRSMFLKPSIYGGSRCSESKTLTCAQSCTSAAAMAR